MRIFSFVKQTNFNHGHSRLATRPTGDVAVRRPYSNPSGIQPEKNINYIVRHESPEARPCRTDAGGRMIGKTTDILASMKLTVVLLLLLLVLTFLGTLYQVEHGIYAAQEKFFSAWFVLDYAVPLPGAQLVLWLLGANLIASLIVKIPRKRASAGLIIMHAGLLLLLFGAFQGLYFSESYMLGMWEGERSNTAVVPGSWELQYLLQEDDRTIVRDAVELESLAEGDDIEDSRLEEHGIIIRVARIAANARLESEEGRSLRVVEPSSEPGENSPGMLVTVETDSGASTPVLLFGPERQPTLLESGNRRLSIGLSPETHSIPFAVELREFDAVFYPGTETPKSFSSIVAVEDAGTTWTREIKMNDPLRYRGYTFYQSSYQVLPDGSEASVFAVRKSSFGWIPYVSVGLVVIGMVLHYGLRFGAKRFSRLRYRGGVSAKPAVRTSRSKPGGTAENTPASDRRGVSSKMSGTGQALILALLAVTGILTVSPKLAAQETSGKTDPAVNRREMLDAFRESINDFRYLRISANGRIMPIDTFSRLSLRGLSGRNGVKGLDADEWLFVSVFATEQAIDLPVVLIEHPDVFDVLGLPYEERGRYSFRDLAGIRQELESIVAGWAGETPTDPVRRDLDNLHHRLSFLTDIFSVGGSRAGAETEAVTEAAVDISREPVFTDSAIASVAEAGVFRIVPSSESMDDLWSPPAPDGEYAQLLERIAKAVRDGDSEAARNEVGALIELQSEDVKALESSGHPRLEVLYNNSRIFLITALLLAGAIVAALIRPTRDAPAVSWSIGVAALLMFTAAMTVRVIITGRPPVTSLYSSILFVGWVATVIGPVFSRRGVRKDIAVPAWLMGGVLIALSSGFGGGQDTLGILQAVLDTNFWLMVHVLTISLGYALNLFAGVVAHLYLGTKILQRYREDRLERLYRLIYAFLASGLVFTFAGTMLGGFWADQAWGRFWGWDPKENGALMIVLWGSILLHARPAGLVKDTGFAVGTVLTIPVVLFSWFGVNLLGVGLHSYGFRNGSLIGLAGFSAFELVLAGSVGLILRARSDVSFPGVRPFVLSARRLVGADTYELRFKPGSSANEARTRAILEAEPGRFVTLFINRPGRTVRRAYSLSYIDIDTSEIGITVKRIEGGAGSTFLTEKLETGKTVGVLGPAGDFGLCECPEESHGSTDGGSTGNRISSPHRIPAVEIFLSAGVGVAPLLPMIRKRLTGHSDARIVLFAGFRDIPSIVHAEEMTHLLDSHDRFVCRIYLSRRTDADDYGVGSPESAGARLLAHPKVQVVDGRFTIRSVRSDFPEAQRFYVCGSDEFVERLEEEIEFKGIDASVWRSERFSPVPEHRRTSTKTHSVNLKTENRTITVHPGQTILRAGLDAGIPLSYSCGVGRCGDCLKKLLAGSVVQDEPNMLSETEREDGLLLTCISYPEEDVEIEEVR